NAAVVNYTLTFSGAVPTVTASNFSLTTTGSITGASVGTPVVASGNSWTIPVNTGTGDGNIRLTVANSTGMSRAIDNLPYDGTIIEIDKTAPVITNIVFATTNADPTKAVAGDVVTMNFTVEETLFEDPTFTIAGVAGNVSTRPDCESYSVSRTILETDATGPISFAGTVTDLVGNTTLINELSTIVIPEPDTTGPVISNVAFTTSNINPAKAMEGDTITFTMTSSELLDDPTYDDVYVIIGNSWEKLTTTDGFTYTATHVLFSSDPAGFINARFWFYDVAGNYTDFSQNSTINYVKLSGDNTLSNLTISPGGVTPAFGTTFYPGGPTITNYQSYSLTGGPTVVTPTANDTAATIKVNGTTVLSGQGATVNLANGSNLINIVVTAENGGTQTYTITASVMGNGDAGLTGLELSNHILKDKVTGTHYRDYVASTDDSTITVTPTASFVGASIVINGENVGSGMASSPINLDMGPNTITTTITSQDAITSHIYSIVVTRKPSGDATLSALVLNPDIAKDKVTGVNYRDYIASVKIGTTSVKVIATTQNPSATLTINGIAATSGIPSDAINLNIGANTINTVVTAADGTVKTYSIVITRVGSSNNKLKSITLNENATVLKTGTISYTTSVASSITQVKVKPLAEDETASVTVNGNPVARGSYSPFILLTDDPIAIQVTAQNGAIQNYTLTVNRNGSNNVRLKSVGLSPSFTVTATSATGYKASVGPTDAVRVKAVPENSNATVTVNGVSPATVFDLEYGVNPFTIVVTAQDGVTTQSYLLNITRDGPARPFSVAKTANYEQATSPEVIVRKAISPNGDGANDVLNISGIESYFDNTLQVINSKGALVTTITGYDNLTNAFNGRSKNGAVQPQGIYYYLLKYKDGKQAKSKSGYFVLKN
ncbi:MAG: cadherin-like beta sandwich domain-containing protein, partial [Mucilaginibacter sp.]